MDRPTHGNCIRWLFAGQAEKERKKTGWQRDTNGFRIGIGYIHIVRRRVSNDFLCFLHLPPPPGVEKRQNACEQGIENGGQHPLVQFDNKRCRDSTWCDGRAEKTATEQRQSQSYNKIPNLLGGEIRLQLVSSPIP
eukprot:scaffold57069_cov18-Tisochrysis_lutea.AAC.3